MLDGNDIGEITINGVLTMYTVPSSSALPTGMAAGPDGSIWFTEVGTGKVGKLPWLASSQGIAPDPTGNTLIDFGTGSVAPLDGNQQTTIPLDFDTAVNPQDDSSAGLGGALGLVANSDTVAPRPIIETTLASDPNGPLPTQIQVTLTWNGVAQAPQTFAVTGHSPGDVYLLDAQAASPVTSTGLYPWMMDIQATLPGGNVIDHTVSGTSGVVVNGATDPLGPGWSVEGESTLVPDGHGNLLWVYGGGGIREFRAGPGNTYVSPPNDPGTLVHNGDGSYTYTAQDQVRSTFNAQGRLTAITDPDGQARTFTYDGSGRLAEVTDPNGTAATFTYSGGSLNEILMPGGRDITLQYTGSNLTSLTDPNGGSRTFTYDPAGHLTNDSWGTRSTTYTYDPGTGTLQSSNEGLGSTLGVVPESIQGLQTNPARSASQNQAVLTDALGRVTTYTLNSLGQETTLQTPDGATQSWQRDFAGQPTVYTDQLGRVTTYTYQYGAGDGELTQVTNPDGSTLRYQYDPTFHQVTREQDPLGRVTTYTYNSNGDPATTTDPLGRVTTDVWSNGLLQSTTDPLGRTTTYQYNSQRQVVDEVDPLGRTTTYSYDGAGNQAAIETPLGRVTTLVYDGNRDLTETIDPLGRVTTYQYDAQGDVTSVTDPLGNVTRYAYDARGLETSETDAFGTPLQRTTTYGYDALGRLVSETNPLGVVTTYAYDAISRPTGETDAVGTPVQRTSTTVYDAVGNVIETIDPLGRVTTYSYDLLNRPTGETDAIGTPVQRSTTTVYDADGEVIATVDPLGRVTTTVYDADGEVIATIDPLGHKTTTVCDADGRGRRRAIDPPRGA